MSNLIKNRLAQVIAVIVILTGSVCVIILPSLRQSLSIIIGGFFVIISPGLALIYVFYPNVSAGQNNSLENITKIDYIERTTLAVLLAIAFIPTTLFIAHRSGIILTHTNVALLIAVVNLLTIAPAVIISKLTSK